MSIYRNHICLLICIVAIKSVLIQSIWIFDKFQSTCQIHEYSNSSIRCGDHIPLGHERVKGRAGYGEAPFLINIQLKSSQANVTTNCTGVVLSKDAILTSLKCIENYRNSSMTTLVGSFNSKKGQEVKIRRTETYNVSTELGDCGHTDFIYHGLALLYLKGELEFNLKKNRKDIYLNNVCFKQTSKSYDSLSALHDFYKGKIFELFNWVSGDNCVKRVQVNLSYCKAPSDHKQGSALERLLCFQDITGTYDQDDLQEGSPIVMNVGGRWALVGIVSKEADLFQRCELSHLDKARFIPIQLKNITDSFDMPAQEIN